MLSVISSCSTVRTSSELNNSSSRSLLVTNRNNFTEQTTGEINPQNSNGMASFNSEAIYNPVDEPWKNGPFNAGVSASLWRDDLRNGYLAVDRRGIQIHDLVTILIFDSAEATSDAKTDVSSKSGISATIEQFLGIPQWLFKRIDTYLSKDSQGNVDLTQPLVKGGSESYSKNEGKTSRKGKIKATITALVTEKTPAGLLKLEGRKHIKVNNEDQVLVISGYARPEDIDSFNQIDSQRLAQVRIEFLGNGSVSSPQRGGWLSNLVRDLWPF
ncbi:MAG: flagellar basal body L-ring protein FlgH [Deltaproteobacteria bacterium]|nr:flagellar basal body L-ring protein FlgH [Deltaproteobacteria bacterium]